MTHVFPTRRSSDPAGGEIAHTFVIFHYGIFPEGIAALAEKGVTLPALATWWDALSVAEAGGYLAPDQVQEVRHFLQDPETWSAAHGGNAGGTAGSSAGESRSEPDGIARGEPPPR